MASEYHIHGIELSPYSVKVRSYFRYKGIPHRWIPRSLDAEGEYQKFAKLPLVPLVVTPDNKGIQDSTPIIEQVEASHPEPSIHPSDPTTKFISALLEEFGDEWGNKWMFHYRWAREADILSAAGRIARSMMPAVDEAQLANGIAMVRERMVPRVSFVGSNPMTAPQIEESFRDTLNILEPHFATRAIPVRKSSRICRLRDVGTALQCVDRSHARRDHQCDHAKHARMDPSHAVAEGRRRFRELVQPCRRP